MRGVRPHHGSLQQTYTKTEAIAALHSIPTAARATLRHYELASMVRPFQSLPPLEPGVHIQADNFLYLAITDWSLYILSKDTVLLEVPWLAVKDLGVDTVDSDTLFAPDEGKQPVRAHIISLVPQVDVHKCPPHISQRVQRAAASLAAGDSCLVAYDKSKGPGLFARLLGLGQYKTRKASQFDNDNKGNAAGGNAVSIGRGKSHQSLQPQIPPRTQLPIRQSVSPGAFVGSNIQQHPPSGNSSSNLSAYHAYVASQHDRRQQHQQEQQHGIVCQPQNSVHSGWLGTAAVGRPIAESTELRYPSPATPIQHHQYHQPAQQKRTAVQDPFAYCNNMLAGTANTTAAATTSLAPQPRSAGNVQQPWQSIAEGNDCTTPSPARCRQRQQNGWLGSTDFNGNCHNQNLAPEQQIIHYYTPTKVSPARKVQYETMQYTQGVQQPSQAMHQLSSQLGQEAASRPAACGVAADPVITGPATPGNQPASRQPPSYRLQSPVLVPVSQPLSEDRWEEAAARQLQEVEPSDIALAKHMLVFSTLEERSRLAHHMRAAWLQAHIRVSAAMAGLPGTPVWFTPPQHHAALVGWIPPACIPAHPSPYMSPADMHAYWQHTALKYLGFGSCNDAALAPDLLVNIFPSNTAGYQPTSTQQHWQVSTTQRSMSAPGRQAKPAAALPNVTGLLQDLAQQLERGLNPRTTPHQVRDAYSGFEARMLLGSSLWDDADEQLLQELLMAWGLCGAPAAHALSAAFLGSPITLAFILSRLSAWSALCHMFCPRPPGPSHADARAISSSPSTPYVEWVLSRNSDLLDGAGQLKAELMPAGHMTPWSAAQQAGSQHRVPAPWDVSPTKHTPAQTQDASNPVDRQTGIQVPAKASDVFTPSSWNQLNEPIAPQTPGNKVQFKGLQPRQHTLSGHGGSFLSPSSQAPGTPGSAGAGGFRPPCSPAGQAGVLHPATPSAGCRDRKINTRLDMDRMTGRQKTSDEEQYAFFLDLYMASDWRGNGCPAPSVSATPTACPTASPSHTHASHGRMEQGRRRTWHGRHLLRMLRLHKGQPPCINETLAAIQLVINSCNERSDGDVGRSKPPAVQPTPTLAPSEPLSLSPLSELPYLFAPQMYAVPTAHEQQQQQACCSHTHGGTAKQAWQSNNTKKMRMNLTVSQHTQAGGDRETSGAATTAIQQAQSRLQGGCVSDALQDGFLQQVLGDVQSPTETRTKAQARWERLVGRLAALRAWRKTCLMLRCVASLVGNSQACEQYASWMSEEVVEVDCVGRSWTWQHCTQLLAGLLPQLKDPSCESLAMTQQPPSGPSDILWWCKAQAHAGWLDSCACIHWHMSDMGKLQACCKGGSRRSNYPGVLLTAMQALPSAAIHTYCQQLLKRAVYVLSGGVNAQQPSAACSRPEAADAVAVQSLELLLELCGRLPGAAAAVHDALEHRMMHTLRTPQVSLKLQSRSSNPVLGDLVLGLLAEVLAMVGDADPGSRPGTMWQAGLSQQQVGNVGSCVTGRHNMPGLLT